MDISHINTYNANYCLSRNRALVLFGVMLKTTTSVLPTPPPRALSIIGWPLNIAAIRTVYFKI